MKRFLLFAVALCFATVVSAQFKVGGGLTLGTKSGGIDDDGDEKLGIGLNIRGEYAFDENWSIAPGFTYFFASAPSDVDITYWQLNADAHYKFHAEGDIGIYALGGLNYSYAEIDWGGNEFWDGSSDDSEIGLNLGVGANMQQFYGELKYDTAFEQIALSVGILF